MASDVVTRRILGVRRMAGCTRGPGSVSMRRELDRLETWASPARLTRALSRDAAIRQLGT